MNPEFRLAMIHAALFWRGTSILDGAFDVFKQIDVEMLVSGAELEREA